MGYIDKFIVMYLDVMTIFSNTGDEHLSHLKQTFKKCRRYGLSLNPNNSIFSLQEGNLLGHIVSKDGFRIDPQRVETIQALE